LKNKKEVLHIPFIELFVTMNFTGKKIIITQKSLLKYNKIQRLKKES